MSSTWNHLSRRWRESELALADFIYHESVIQERLESTGYSSPTWRLQRALQNIHGATCVQGESAVTAPPFFKHAGRRVTDFWGDNQERHQGPTVFLRLDDQGRQQCIEVVQKRTDWVVWARTSAQNREARRHREFESHGRVFAGQGARGKVAVGVDEKTAQDNNGGNSCRWKGWCQVETGRCQNQRQSMAYVVLGPCGCSQRRQVQTSTRRSHLERCQEG